MRPKSIVQFERVYSLVILLGIVATVIGWDDMMASVQVQQMVAQFGMILVWIPLALGIGLQLVFLYFIARRGSLVVKWIFVVLSGLGILWSTFTLLTGQATNTPDALLNAAQIVLQVIAIVLVFRPDTAEWFGENPVTAE